jgi:hypothetical protein
MRKSILKILGRVLIACLSGLSAQGFAQANFKLA